MKEALESWYADLEDGQRATASQLRDIVLSQGPDLREELKWNQPCFYGQSLVCYLQKAKSHVALGFGKGAELTDPNGLLQGSGNQMRHLKFPLNSPIDRAGIVDLVDDAIRRDRTLPPA